jgi:hypothetical protein
MCGCFVNCLYVYFPFELITAEKNLKLCTWKISKYKHTSTRTDLYVRVEDLFYRIKKHEFILLGVRNLTMTFLSI